MLWAAGWMSDLSLIQIAGPLIFTSKPPGFNTDMSFAVAWYKTLGLPSSLVILELPNHLLNWGVSVFNVGSSFKTSSFLDRLSTRLSKSANLPSLVTKVFTDAAVTLDLGNSLSKARSYAFSVRPAWLFNACSLLPSKRPTNIPLAFCSAVMALSNNFLSSGENLSYKSWRSKPSWTIGSPLTSSFWIRASVVLYSPVLLIADLIWLESNGMYCSGIPPNSSLASMLIVASSLVVIIPS